MPRDSSNDGPRKVCSTLRQERTTSSADLLDAGRQLAAALLHLRLVGREGRADRQVVRASLASATSSTRILRNSADGVILAYLSLVEAVLDLVRDAVTIGDFGTVERAADLVHNVPQLVTDPEGWSHRFFRTAFMDAWARQSLSLPMQQLEEILELHAPPPSRIAAMIVENHRKTQCWSTTRAAVESAGRAVDVDEEEIGLRVLHALGWPEVEHEDHVEVAAIAMAGDEALWSVVVGQGAG